jgi:hypothetical protein
MTRVSEKISASTSKVDVFPENGCDAFIGEVGNHMSTERHKKTETTI